ncbi:MAG: hypothetical protein GY716_06250 [bacterium]|nr:hypothetical protein [bacterium]
MLPELLHRDWVLNRKHLLLFFAIFSAYQVYAVLETSTSRTWLVFACIYASFLAVTLFIREDKFGAIGWSCTLPITRRDLVRARFVAGWILVLLALAGALLIVALVPGGNVTVAGVLQPSTLLIAAAVVTFVFALMQPFTIRFGFLGVIVFLVGIQVLGVAALALASTLGSGRSGGGRPIRDTLSMLSDGLAFVRGSMPYPAFALLVLVVLAVVNWLGYRAALALFSRREL